MRYDSLCDKFISWHTISQFSAAIMENYILQDILKTIGRIVTFFVSTPRFSGSGKTIGTKSRLCDVLLLCNHQPQDGHFEKLCFGDF